MKVFAILKTAADQKRSMLYEHEVYGIVAAGASASDSRKVGNIILSNLLKMDRQDLYAVNPKGGCCIADGRSMPLYPSVQAIDAAVDLAVIIVPAVTDCADKGVRAMILVPGGFAEIHRNQDVEAHILRLARDKGFRVMGPNCLGIIYAGGADGKGFNTFFAPYEKFTLSFEKETMWPC